MKLKGKLWISVNALLKPCLLYGFGNSFRGSVVRLDKIKTEQWNSKLGWKASDKPVTPTSTVSCHAVQDTEEMMHFRFIKHGIYDYDYCWNFIFISLSISWDGFEVQFFMGRCDQEPRTKVESVGRARALTFWHFLLAC